MSRGGARVRVWCSSTHVEHFKQFFLSNDETLELLPILDGTFGNFLEWRIVCVCNYPVKGCP
jgi:hypothetical protein